MPPHYVSTVFSIILMAIVPEASYTSDNNRNQTANDIPASLKQQRAAAPLHEGRREGRIFTFNNDKNEIRIELGFTIPFVRIPVGRTEPDGSLVNVNLGAVLAGGLLSAAATVFAPSVFTGLDPVVTFGRGERSTADGARTLLARMDAALRRHGADTASCAQRVTCWALQSSSSSSTSTSTMHQVLDALASTQWLEQTAVGRGVRAAHQRADCSRVFPDCAVSWEQLAQGGYSLLAGTD